jgi:hypothetical protein
MSIEFSPDHLREPVASSDTVVACLSRLNSVDGAAPIEADQRVSDLGTKTIPLSRVVRLAAEFGFQAEPTELDWAGLKATGFTHPILVLRKDNDAVIVTGGGRAGAEEVSVWDPHHDGVVFFVPREDFERHWNGHALIMNVAERTLASSAATPGVSDFAGLPTPEGPDVVLTSMPPSLEKRAPRLSSNLRFCLAAVAILPIFAFGAYYFVGRDAPPTSADLSAADVGALLARGDALFSDGDLAAARLLYERAANAGDGQAAIRLGETFDPGFLEHVQLRGTRGDRSTALSWYRRARELGATEAELLLRSLEAEKDQ